jgi:hypothetical protein
MTTKFWNVGELAVREPTVWIGVDDRTGRLVVRIMERNYVREECVITTELSRSIAQEVLKTTQTQGERK